MKLTVDIPEDTFEVLAKWAIQEHRFTPQQASYLLTRWARDGQPPPSKPLEPITQVGVKEGAA